MTTITVSPGQLGARMGHDEKARHLAWSAATYAAALMGARVIRSVVPVNTGDARRSVVVERLSDGVHGPVARIVVKAPYVAYHEAGTRPFTPPLGPLFAWAKSQAANLGITSDSDMWRIAVGIRNRYAREGIKAKWFIRDAQPKLARILREVLKAAGLKGQK